MTKNESWERAMEGFDHKPSLNEWQQARATLAQPERSMKVEGPLHVVCQCNWCKAHPEQNLSCKSVQARLATAWGYVKAQPEEGAA
jgi:hypothetical protein